jgi:hypothetical protein
MSQQPQREAKPRTSRVLSLWDYLLFWGRKARTGEPKCLQTCQWQIVAVGAYPTSARELTGKAVRGSCHRSQKNLLGGVLAKSLGGYLSKTAGYNLWQDVRTLVLKTVSVNTKICIRE